LIASGEFIVSALIGGLGLSTAGVYFLVRLLPPSLPLAPWQDLDTPEGVRKSANRRLLGMFILAIVSVGLFLGVNFIDPIRFPVHFTIYWVLVLLMVLWLLVIALADIRHTLTLHRLWAQRRVQTSLERYLRAQEKSGISKLDQGDSP